MPFDPVTATALTPHRTSSLTLDFPEPVLEEPYFAMRRLGGQLKPVATSNALLLQSNTWILKPLNADLWYTRETTAGQSAVMRLSDFNAAGVVKEAPFFRQLNELAGLSYDTGVTSSGDYFLTKRVGAGDSWASAIASAEPSPTLSSSNQPMDRLIAGPTTGTHDAMTGYVLKLLAPGPLHGMGDNFATFYFGGVLLGSSTFGHTGYGRFALALSGDGLAALFEWIDGAWAQVAGFRYVAASNVGYGGFIMTILPHMRHIQFNTQTSTPIQVVSKMGDPQGAFVSATRGETMGIYTHEVTNRPDGMGAHSAFERLVTGPGSVALDIRRDLRPMWQISRLVYPASGTITDSAFMIPGVGTGKIVRFFPLSWDYYSSPTAQVTDTTFTAKEARTGTALTAATESGSFNGTSYTYDGFTPPGGQNLIQAIITLSTSESAPRYHTPSFQGYEIYRDGVVTNPNLTTAITGITPREYSITGPGLNPEDETASALISDATNSLPILQTRGMMSARIDTTYDALDVTKKSVLFEGYVGRADSRLRGKYGATYPSANWHDVDVSMMGKWARMRDTFFMDVQSFADDRTCPRGPDPGATSLQPWRITDIIRFCIRHAGWGDDQIDVFDDPLRLFPMKNEQSGQYYLPAPGTTYGDYILELARTLNAFFVWDANAGSAGMWRLLRPPDGTETPLWNFVTTPSGPGTLPNLSASYTAGFGANTSPILGVGPLQTYIVPPEATQVTVFGGPRGDSKDSSDRFQQVAVNRQAYNAPGFSLADPTSLDYTGRCIPLVYTDMTLRSQGATDFICRRLFELACRGRKLAQWTSELCLVSPTDSVYSTHTKRPLRTGDTITLNGARWIVHSCNPQVKRDAIMLQHVEAELFRDGVTYG